MIAKILQSGYDNSGNFPAASIVPAFSGGLDKQALHKQASIFEKEYDQFERKPGHTYIHLISCAAGEFYGPNSRADFYNGDSYRHDFPEPEKGGPKFVILDGGLNKYHNKTFMEEGGVYTEHFSSRDGAKPQGYIVAAKINPEMHRGELIIGVKTKEWEDDIEKLSSGKPLKFSIGADTAKDTCFPKGTLVLTDCGYKPIEALNVGDAVKAADGELHEVVATSVRYATQLTRIGVTGLPLEIESTDNHPYCVVRATQLRACQGSVNSKEGLKKRRHTPDVNGRCVICHRQVNFEASWVSARDIQVDDYLKIKVDPCAEKNTVGTDFAYLCGMYIGDGSLILSKVSRDDKRGTDLGVQMSGISISMAIDEEGKEITDKIKDLYTKVTGKYAVVFPESGGKHAVKINLYDRLLAARIYELCGAGSHTKAINDQIFHWSRDEKAAFVAGYLDADGNITDSARASRITSINRGLALGTQRLLWSIGVRATCYLGNRAENVKPHNCYRCTGHCYAVGFREFPEDFCKHSVKLLKHPEFLSHKMNGSNVLLNNGYAYARVMSVRTFESSPVAVYNIEVAGDHTYNAEGADVHNCSICGHIAHTEKQHCDHYKNNRGLVLEDGSQVYVITDNCVFHDISRVRNPAEKIAFSIKKIANADDFSLWQPGRIKPESTKYLLKTATGLRRFETLDKLAKIEKEIMAVASSGSLDKNIEKFFKAKKQQKRASEQDSGELLNKFLSHVNQDQLFNGLKENNKILTPGEFTVVAVPESYRNGGYGIDIEEIEKLLPGIFNKILHRDDVDEFCEDETYECDTQCPKIIVDQIGRVPCGCSLDINDLMRSVVNAEDVDLTPTKRTVIIEISKPVTNVNELIADDYASYVVSAADRLSPTELAMNILNYVL